MRFDMQLDTAINFINVEQLLLRDGQKVRVACGASNHRSFGQLTLTRVNYFDLAANRVTLNGDLPTLPPGVSGVYLKINLGLFAL